ncbi:serine/threonine-protein kinase [Streptomyces sp. NPDC051098]|uniref:serine/threonine-protein kinase n=1 Tax=Streptomyces sp. NPDC051098 TaxID=3155411 RepID=UPI0034459233
MGTVWLARDEVVGRDCALKEPRLPGDPSDPVHQRLCRRLRREARAAAQVEHPSAVSVHDVVTDGGLPWIVMELVRGESLHALLKRGTLTPGETARIGLAVLGALAAAHAKGIIHRDVKPANVLLGPHGRVVLTDFGIARVQGEEPLTVSGEFVGSLESIAPERMQGVPAGPESDLWSLGVLLYASVEGWSPFRRTTLESTLAAILQAEPPAPVQAGPLGDLIVRLLAKEPSHRPSAQEVERELASVAAGRASPLPGAADASPEPQAPTLQGPETCPELAVDEADPAPGSRVRVAGGRVAGARVTGLRVAGARVTGFRVARPRGTGLRVARPRGTGLRMAEARVTGLRVARLRATALRIALPTHLPGRPLPSAPPTSGTRPGRGDRRRRGRLGHRCRRVRRHGRFRHLRRTRKRHARTLLTAAAAAGDPGRLAVAPLSRITARRGDLRPPVVPA